MRPFLALNAAVHQTLPQLLLLEHSTARHGGNVNTSESFGSERARWRVEKCSLCGATIARRLGHGLLVVVYWPASRYLSNAAFDKKRLKEKKSKAKRMAVRAQGKFGWRALRTGANPTTCQVATRTEQKAQKCWPQLQLQPSSGE